MPADSDDVQAYGTRIAILERQASEVRTTLKELTNDVRQLVAVMTQQAEDRAALKRAFQQIERLADKVELLDASMQSNKEEKLREEAALAKEELKQVNSDRRRVIWLVLSYALAASVGAFFNHFGIPMVTR